MFKRILFPKNKGLSLIVVATLLLLVAIPLEVFFDFTSGLNPFISKMMWFAIVVLSLLEILMFYNFYQLRRLQSNFEAGGKNIPYLDVTEQNLTPPEKLEANIRELEALGFTSFAVLDASDKHDGSRLLWYWADESHTIRAYIALLQPFNRVVTAFITVLEDDAAVETAYRVQMQMDAGTLHVRNVTTSIEAAYDYHQHQLAIYEAQHGAPVVISSPAELLDYSNRLKKVHHPLVYKNRIENVSRYLAFYGLTIAGFILALFLAPWIDLLISFAMIGILIGVSFSIFNLEETDASFGSVEKYGKKKKHS